MAGRSLVERIAVEIRFPLDRTYCGLLGVLLIVKRSSRRGQESRAFASIGPAAQSEMEMESNWVFMAVAEFRSGFVQRDDAVTPTSTTQKSSFHDSQLVCQPLN